MANNSFDHHRARVIQSTKNDYQIKYNALTNPRDEQYDKRSREPGKFWSTHNDNRKKHSLAVKAYREKNTRTIGQMSVAQTPKAATIEPFYNDFRNLFVSNLVREYSIPVKNKETVNNNLAVAILLGGLAHYVGMLDKYLVLQSTYTLLDLTLESLPISYEFRDLALGGGLGDYHKKLDQ